MIAFWFFPQIPTMLRRPVRLLFLALIVSGVVGIWRVVCSACEQPRRSLFVLAAVTLCFGISYLCSKAVCWTYLRVITGDRDPFALTEVQAKAAEAIIAGEGEYVRQSRELGWTIIPGASSSNSKSKANMQGIRANREYSTSKPPNVVRALCFGDSFTHCNEVSNDETWPHYAEQAGGVEFLSFGVGGYGMTQALLRYLHEGRAFETDVVILGCMSNDIRRSVNAYYPFRLADPSEAPSVMGIPYASLDTTGNLALNPNPLPDADAYRELLAHPGKRLRELSKLDLLFHPVPPTPLLTVIKSKAGDELAELWSDASIRLRRNLNIVLSRKNVHILKQVPLGEDDVNDPKHPVFPINCRVFDRFVADVKSTGARPLILWLPGRKDFARKREGRELIYKPFLDHFASKEYDFIDTMDWIAADMPGERCVAPDKILFAESHYSAETNRVIGRRIADHVRKMVSPK